VTARQQVTIRIGRPVGSNLVAVLRLFNAQGRQLAMSSGPDAVLTFTFQTGGTYYVGVSGKGNAAYDPISGKGAQPGYTGDYSIALTPGPRGKVARNGQLDQAATLGVLGKGARTFGGTLGDPGATQFFSFSVAGGQGLAFAVTGHGNLKPYLGLFDGNGIELANSGASGKLQFTFLVGATYFLAASAEGNAR
jgi:hypothetical protein